jgi:hypothetical protein
MKDNIEQNTYFIKGTNSLSTPKDLNDIFDERTEIEPDKSELVKEIRLDTELYIRPISSSKIIGYVKKQN